MRVLLMGPYPPPHGGVQTNLVSIRRLLLKRGIPCQVINLTRHRHEEAGDIHYPKNALEVVKLLFVLEYDILHLHIGGDLSTRLVLLGLVCTLIAGRRTVLTFHSGGYPSSEAGSGAGPFTLRGFVLRRFDRLIGVNQELTDLYRRFGVSEKKIRLIYPHSVSRESVARELPERMARFFESHDPSILTVSGLEPEYEVPLQIDVLGSIRQRFPSAGLMIIGTGSLEEQVRGEIERKPYAEHVLLCGDVPHPVTLRAISESDLFLRTTQYDGDSISVREALYSGIPVIATDNGMRPEGIRLIPRPEAEPLRQAIEEVLGGDRLQNLDPADAGERNIEEVYELYRELVSETGR